MWLDMLLVLLEWKLIPGISSSWLLRLISSGLESSEQKGSILQFFPGTNLVWTVKSIPIGHGGSGVQVTPR